MAIRLKVIKRQPIGLTSVNQKPVSLKTSAAPATRWGGIIGDISNQEDLIALIQNINIADLQQDSDSYLILDCGTSVRVMEDLT